LATFAKDSPQTFRDIQESSRLARVAKFVGAVQDAVFGPIQEKVDFRFSSFDGTYARLVDQDSPGLSLATFLSSDDPSKSNTGLVTDVSTALENLNREQQGQPLAAIFLVTDMAHNRPGSRNPREVAAELGGVPVYVVPIGNTGHVRDIDLKSVLAPNVVMKDDDIVIEAHFQAYDCEGETCTVQLLQGGKVIQQRDVELASAIASRKIRFDMRMSEVGTHRYQVRVVPLEGELSEGNNFKQFEVNVTRNTIKLLVADEMPRWEYRYLTQLFRRDQNVECDELLFHPRIIATGERKEAQGFPKTVDDWAHYDVVLLGDVSTEHLPTAAQESLVRFLRERGGTLVMIAGDEFMPQAYVNQPLEDILPVTQVTNINAAESADGYAFQITQSGWEHHALMIGDTRESTRIAWDFINRNAPFYSLSSYRRPRPSARTLISAVPRSSLDEPGSKENAFLCWQPVGRGRIVYLAGPETYRLRFLRGDRLHYRFWGQMLRWAIATDLAAGSNMVRVRTDKSSYDNKENVQVVVRLLDEEQKAVSDAKVEAIAIRADDARVTIPLEADPQTPGRYVGRFDRLEPGIYRIEPSGPDVERLTKSDKNYIEGASFTVRSNLKSELHDTRCDRALAQQIADVTGGQVLPPTAIKEVLALTNLKPVITETMETVPLWVQWKYLWIVFGCLLTEWVVRKRMGLS
jgi:hypothetical protein